MMMMMKFNVTLKSCHFFPYQESMNGYFSNLENVSKQTKISGVRIGFFFNLIFSLDLISIYLF